MNILVTGSSGQIGSQVFKRLGEKGHHVTPFDLKHGQDIRDENHIESVFDSHERLKASDTIAHLAGIPWPKINLQPEEYWRTNVEGTRLLVEYARRHERARIVYASSTAYYGFNRGFPMPDCRVGERDPSGIQHYLRLRLPDMADARNQAAVFYMVSKIAAESALAMHALADELDVVILRIAPVTPEPYEWGLQCDLSLAVDTFVWALQKPMSSSLEIYNVANSDVTALDTSRLYAELIADTYVT